MEMFESFSFQIDLEGFLSRGSNNCGPYISVQYTYMTYIQSFNIFHLH